MGPKGPVAGPGGAAARTPGAQSDPDGATPATGSSDKSSPNSTPDVNLTPGAPSSPAAPGITPEGQTDAVDGTPVVTPDAPSVAPSAEGSTPGAGGAPALPGTSEPPALPVEPAVCEGAFEAPSLDGEEHMITVDDGASWGELPHFWNTYGTGHMGLFMREDRGWGETLRNHVIDGVLNLGLTSMRQHGLFHEDIGIYHEENGTPVYDFSISDQIFDFFVENGVEPIVELGSMPRDLARDPSQVWFDWDMGKSPPKDFALWQELVYQFVQHSVDRYGADIVGKWYFEVWNEPECCRNQFWTGTLDEYFELYDHSVAGVKRALPGGRVGGPVASQPIELTENSMLGTLFLDHVSTDNYVNPGSPGTLDFFAYHSWSFIDGAVNGYFDALNLLDQHGYSNVGIAITEFGPTWEFGLDDEPQENENGAVFVAQTYSDISQRCAKENKRFPITYSWWVLSDIFEEGMYREGDPFIGCMGLITRENIRKPAYNAYKFLAQMGNEQISLSGTGDGVGGMAAKDPSGGVQVLLYNGQNPGQGPTDGVYYAQGDPQQIGLTISGLPADLPYDVSVYRIDHDNGNAYQVWQAMGRPPMSSMSDANWQSLRDNMDSLPEPMGENLCGTTFQQTFSLPSPGVLFVKLTPSVG